jgi:hypothetical protein
LSVASDSALVFDAELRGFNGISRQIAMRSDQTLVDLHTALQAAFGWADDHLYSFWLSDQVFDTEAPEYTSPIEAEPGMATADVVLADLALEPGQPVSYLFDFGDHWEVGSHIVEVMPADDEPYPRVVETTGTAPPQYADEDDDL